ncbi:hypothetical protein BN8_02017 [Fibrisoma limi BUZ 3]|uniref:Uncharacterized protein n=1 Tax=Fibrisoma limi BUZ 3 TaxID=1185876 RepID=I2GGE2_9BACT|nr:hypothetical protein BN8_02017 [Fibrisoma limi BUZ 3]
MTSNNYVVANFQARQLLQFTKFSRPITKNIIVAINPDHHSVT